MRSRTNKVLGGVCGGFAEYLDADPTLVRLIWLVVALMTGVGFIAYLVAWLVMSLEPEGHTVVVQESSRRLTRSLTDRKWAGVCGGIAEYIGVDSTLVRLIWAVLTIVPGGIIGGFLAYFIAWLVIPLPERRVLTSEPVAHSS